MKADNKKLVIGVFVVALVLFIGYVSYTFYRSFKAGLVASYVNQKTAVFAGEDIVSVKAPAPKSEKAILDGYYAVKYTKDGKVESGTFYFNGNFQPDGKNPSVSLWQILFVGQEKK